MARALVALIALLEAGVVLPFDRDRIPAGQSSSTLAIATTNLSENPLLTTPFADTAPGTAGAHLVVAAAGVGSFAEVSRKPVFYVGARNLLRNGSFEVGTYGWTWHTAYPHEAPVGLAVRPVVDREGVVAAPELGNASLKLEIPAGVRGFILESGYLEVRPGQQYTFSFFARSDRPVPLAAGVGDPEGSVFPVGDQWSRYTFSVWPTEKWVRVSIWQVSGSPNTLWLDGLQLSAGPLIAFVPQRPAEVGVASDQPHNLYRVGEEVRPVFWVCRHRQQGAYRLAFRTEEILTGGVIAEAEVMVQFPEGSSVAELAPPYALPSLRQGVFKTTARLTSTEGHLTDWCEYIHAVCEPLAITPDQLDEDSIFATDHLMGWHHYLGHGGRDSMQEYFRLAAQAGIRWHRDESFRMKWALPEPGTFQVWDNLVDLAREYGIGVMVTLGPEDHPLYIPDWAYEEPREIMGYDGLTYYRIRLDAWREYCHRLMEHFQGRVRYYECLNERHSNPVLPQYLQVAHEEAQSVAPGAQILSNLMGSDVVMLQEGTMYVDAETLRQIFREQEWPHFDMLSLHLYQSPENDTPPDLVHPSYAGVLGYMRDLLQQCGPEKPIWDTEGGILASSLYSHMTPDLSRSDFYDPQRGWVFTGMTSKYTRERQAVLQAAYHVRKAIIYTHLGVKRLFYFTFNHTSHVEPYCSMLEFDDTPRLIYVAQAQCARHLSGAVPLRQLELPDERMRAYLLRRRDGRQVVTLWNVRDEPIPYSIALPTGEVEVFDMVGNPVLMERREAIVALPTSACPLYLLPEPGAEDKLVQALEQGTGG
jgi:hypothetical protein